MMLDAPKAGHGELGFDRVEKLMISSAPAGVDTKRAIMEMFPNSGLFELYGSTEAGWVTMLHPDEQFDKLGTVGREVVGSAPINMLDDDGQEVADGESRELFSCGPSCFDGYWNLPEKTAKAFRPRLSTTYRLGRSGATTKELKTSSPQAPVLPFMARYRDIEWSSDEEFLNGSPSP